MLFLQTCYNLKAFATKADQRLLATQIAREGERMSAEAPSPWLWTDYKNNPTGHTQPAYVPQPCFLFPSLQCAWLLIRRKPQVHAQYRALFLTCKPRRFLRGMWLVMGDRSCCRQLRNPGAGTCLPMQQGFTCGESSFLICHSWSCTSVKQWSFNCNLSQLSKHLAN